MQSMTRNSFKWILVYQDHLTKFVILRPLTSKRAAEVAHHLLDIFLLVGAPAILQSDNGSEFTAEVISELKLMWPRLVIVHGKPRHPQSQGSVERANGDIKDMLVAWMGDNNTDDWPVGIKFIQFQKNSSLHSGIKRSPYAAMFGCEAKVGLTSSPLPHEVLDRIQNEEDLLSVLSDQQPDSRTNQEPTSQEPTQAETEEQRVSCSEQSPISVIEEVTPVDEEESSDMGSTSDLLDVRLQNIETERDGASSALMQQAQRMVKRSRLELVSGQIGDNVAVPIPLVDRGRGDPRNILGIVMDHDENDLYTICVKAGVLKNKFTRNQFDLCPQRLITESDVDTSKKITLHQAVKEESSCGGQGYIRCNCAGTKRCCTNRCKCFKSNIKCSSRCHSSLSCKNK